MDLSNFDSIGTTTARVYLEGPDGRPLQYDTGETEKDPETGDDKPVLAQTYIDVVSKDSPEYQRVFKAQVTKSVQRTTKAGGKVKVTGDTADADRLELLVACTKGWNGFELNGREFPYTQRNANTLYTRFKFIREQVEEFIADRGNFLPGASTS